MVHGFHKIGDGFPGMVHGFHEIGGWIPHYFWMDSIPFSGWSPYGIITSHIFYAIFRVDSIWNKLKYIQ
jgi:hypothetical protein